MIQDIMPHEFHNEYTPREPKDTDYVFVFRNHEPIFLVNDEERYVPTFGQIKEMSKEAAGEVIYLFSIDETACFYSSRGDLFDENEGNVEFSNLRYFRTFKPQWLAFAGITAGHLERWYGSHQYCGCCGKPMVQKKDERAMLCEHCGFLDYPKICPVIIVGVTNGDEIMMTRYANRSFKRYALVAGFCEIGETLEDTVRREVMEEVGIKVKNIRYFDSQPWGFSQSLLMGFFAELDGDKRVTMDTEELCEAAWFPRNEIPEDQENELSLTYTMMKAFKDGKL